MEATIQNIAPERAPGSTSNFSSNKDRQPGMNERIQKLRQLSVDTEPSYNFV